MEKHARTIFKTLSWRILATSTTVLLVYFFTENLLISVSVSMTEMGVKTLIYYVHERAWDKTDFGRKISNLPNLNSHYPTSITKRDKNREEMYDT